MPYKKSSEDTVKVVRCRNCRHYYFADNRIPKEQGWVCAFWNIDYFTKGIELKPTDYCSHGERKE